MFIGRIFSLLGGKLTRWIKARESRDPEAVYEAAISERMRRYRQLKEAAAGVIYMRTKLDKELRAKSAEMTEVDLQTAQAVDMNEDQCAIILIQRKNALSEDCTRLRQELSELTGEAEEAKKNLVGFKNEIERLKIEKVRMLARLKNAQARARIARALEQMPYEEDVRALEEVREFIARTLASASVNRELHGTELGEKLDRIRAAQEESQARAQLEEIKRRRRSLAPLEIFKQAAESAAAAESPNGSAGVGH